MAAGFGIRLRLRKLKTRNGTGHMGGSDKIRAKTATNIDRNLIEIGIVIYPGALMSAVLGLTDLFNVANRLSVERGGSGAKPLRTSHWQMGANGVELERVFDSHEGSSRPLTALILPPNLDTDPQGEAIAKVQAWVKEQHSAGTLICSVCGGAFMLAKTGLLNGRCATTHWTLTDTLADRFPRIRVQAERMVIDDGDIITAWRRDGVDRSGIETGGSLSGSDRDAGECAIFSGGCVGTAAKVLLRFLAQAATWG